MALHVKRVARDRSASRLQAEPNANFKRTSQLLSHANGSTPPHHHLNCQSLPSCDIRLGLFVIATAAMALPLVRMAAARTGTRAPIVATRAFQTSAALRQEGVVAPVRKPVGAFRGG